MRRVRQDRTLRRVGQGRWRDAATVLALLVLLTNQALPPAFHLGVGRQQQTAPASRSQHTIHVKTPGSHAGHEEQGGGHGEKGGTEPDGAGHQTCHFCRLVGTALPPPPPFFVDAAVESGNPTWVVVASIRPREHARIGRRARAPPQIV